jgi:uncharacterized membrane protein YhfC
MQVSVFSMFFMAISAIISIGLPIILFIISYKKYGAKFLPLIIGIFGFVLFALVLERSIHLIVLSKFALMEKPFLYVIYGIFMAGVFEETARFVSFKILKKKYNGIGTGFAYGIGHGGIESIILVGLTMVNTIILSIMLNMGNIETITGKLQGETLNQVNMQITSLLTTAPYSFLIGGAERFFAIGVQLSLSVIVYYSVYGKNKLWLYPFAILLHAAVDIPAVLMQIGIIKSILFVELCVFISAAVLILMARNIHKKLYLPAAASS